MLGAKVSHAQLMAAAKEREVGRLLLVILMTIESFGMRWCLLYIMPIQNGNKGKIIKQNKSMHMTIPFEHTILVVREKLSQLVTSRNENAFVKLFYTPAMFWACKPFQRNDFFFRKKKHL